MMKLLYIGNSLAIFGGVERVLVDKLNWFAEYGDCKVHLLTVNQGEHPVVFPLHPGVDYQDLTIQFHHKYRYSGWKRYYQEHLLHKLFQRRLDEKIREISPDVIICTRLELIHDVMKVNRDVPVVYEAHNSYLDYKFERSSWMQKLQTKLRHQELKKVQKIVALTRPDALEWKKLNPHVEVIPNVVHLNDTDQVSDCQSKSCIFAGRYSYQKDIKTLMRIWEIVQQRHPDWLLHLYGGYGDQQDELLPEISRMGMNIVVHQPTAVILEEFLKSSMLLMTSRYEPFGLVLPEAMSCGLPVVAFDCPYGPADIITDGVDGFLIKERSVEEFANRVCQLIENEQLRVQMGKRGMDSSQRYSTEAIMPKWAKLFEQLTRFSV